MNFRFVSENKLKLKREEKAKTQNSRKSSKKIKFNFHSLLDVSNKTNLKLVLLYFIDISHDKKLVKYD